MKQLRSTTIVFKKSRISLSLDLIPSSKLICKSCGKKFHKHIPPVPKYQRTTDRLWMYVLDCLNETKSMKPVAKNCNLSSMSIARIIDKVSYGISYLPEVISIDEFKGNAGRKFQCILTNPKKHEVLDILPERSIESLSGYFATFSNRNTVKYYEQLV